MKQSSEWIKTKLVFGALLVATIALWAFEETTANLFVWDSNQYLLRHENHISHLSMENIYWMMTSLEFFNWHPLTWLSWAIDYQIYGGLDSWGYHFSNNVLHSLNSVLVFILMLVVFALTNPDSKTYRINTDNHSLIAAVLTALMFAVHPQHVESVAWVAERKDLLCQLFLLLSMLAYVKYVTCQATVKIGWFLGTLAIFAGITFQTHGRYVSRYFIINGRIPASSHGSAATDNSFNSTTVSPSLSDGKNSISTTLDIPDSGYTSRARRSSFPRIS